MRAFCRRDLQSCLRHKSEESKRFQGDRFTARVRTCDHQRIKRISQRNRDRNDFLGVKQRVTRRTKIDHRMRLQKRRGRTHTFGKCRAGKVKRKLGDQLIIQRDRSRKRSAFRRKLGKDTVDLLLFLASKLTQFIVRFYNADRFDKQGRTGCRRIVQKTLDLVAIFGAHGNNVSAVTNGNEVFLQIFRARPRYEILQRFLDSIIRGTHFSTNIREQNARLIRNHFLGNNGAVDLFFQRSIGHQTRKRHIKRRGKQPIGFAVILQSACRIKKSGYVQKLSNRKRCSFFGAVGRVANVDNVAERRIALMRCQAARIRCFLLFQFYRFEIIVGHELGGSMPCAFREADLAKHADDLIVFQIF